MVAEVLRFIGLCAVAWFALRAVYWVVRRLFRRRRPLTPEQLHDAFMAMAWRDSQRSQGWR